MVKLEFLVRLAILYHAVINLERGVQLPKNAVDFAKNHVNVCVVKLDFKRSFLARYKVIQTHVTYVAFFSYWYKN